MSPYLHLRAVGNGRQIEETVRFYLIDRVDEIHPGEGARGIKNIAMSDDILRDHFPENPIFPGTLIVESLAQLGGFLVEATFNKNKKDVRRAVLAQIEKAKFHEPCRPGDQLRLECRLVSSLEGAAQIEGEAQVNGTKVARATLTFVLRKVDSKAVHEQRKDLYKQWTRGLKLKFPIL